MNIVIADDEEIILKWMKRSIEALSPENHVVEICSNGKQALNCCMNQKIDVLFTDIRMPIMDGMELLKKLNDNRVLPYTIILSAYDDFSYARDCFKLGVKEFLLKSEITREELEKCLQIVEKEMENVHGDMDNPLSGREQFQNLLQKNFRDEEAVSKSTLKQYWDEFCDIKEKFIVLTLHSFSKNIHQEHCKEIAAFLFQEEGLKFYCIQQSEKKIIILAESPGENLSVFSSKLYNGFASFGYREISINVSRNGCSYEELNAMHVCAEEVFFYQAFYEKFGGVDYETMTNRQSRIYPQMEQQFKEIEEMLNARKWNEIVEKMQYIFVFIRENMPTIPVVRRLVLNFLLNVYWNCLDEKHREGISIDSLISMSNRPELEQLERLTLEQTELFMTQLIGKQSVYSDAVWSIIQYIETYYADTISLEELANHVHMNRSYISHLFKKETGENINNFLLNFRLKKAKELLVGRKCSIQQICYEIGIPDSAYFSKVFKKTIGVSPLEFRKINQ